jgi:putative membrane protein
MNRTSLAALSLLLGSTLLHCGGDQKPAEAPEPASSLAPAELPPAPTTGPDAGAPPTGPQAAAEATPPAATQADTLNDEQIAAITDEVNSAEIEQGKLARLKSKDTAVQKFAARMIAAHEEAQKNQEKLKLPTAESALGNKLGTESTSAMNTLKGSDGADFDKAYIDAQVEQHQKLLDALNDQLLPNVKNPDLKAYLKMIQPHVVRHLKDAQGIQQAVGSKTGAAGSAAGKHAKP